VSSESILCRRCGAANSAGDQFCGSCGAFLEWEGEALELDGAAAPEAAAPADAAPLGADVAARPTPAPAPPASVPPEQPGGVPAAGGVTCRACGRPNPPGRTFCQACGTRLAAGSATSVTPVVPAGQPTAGAGRSPARPRGSSREARATGASRGLPGWLPVVVVLGLLAGVGGVAAAALLRPPEVPSGASSEPGTPPATLTPTLPAASPVDSVAATGSPVPPAAVALTMTGATASSVVGNREMFAASMVIDGELTTCWQEGADEEAGEWIEVTFEASRLAYVVVYSGYQLSHDAYLANRRPKDVSVSVDGGPAQAFVLADTEVPQRIAVGDLPGATRVRITIVSTYDPEATAYPGSPFDDLAISEIRAFGVPGG
jgi:hypothetical protein